MDIVARLLDGPMLTGAIKWNRQPVGIALHHAHLRDLNRLADSGQGWAHEAMEKDSILLYAAAGGFEEGFAERAAEEGHSVVMWDLEDLYY